MKRITVLVCCLVLTLSIVAGLAGCANGLGVAGQNVDPGKPSHPTESAPLPIEPASYKLTPDTFDENLLQYIASVTEGSYMVSPLSFRYALGLLHSRRVGRYQNRADISAWCSFRGGMGGGLPCVQRPRSGLRRFGNKRA